MPLLRSTEKNLHRTRRGRVICKCLEVYGRDDIGCGSLFCLECTYKEPMKPTLSNTIYIIPTLKVVMHQIDILTSPEFLSKFNVILLQSIIDHIKSTNYGFFKRIESELIEAQKHSASMFVFMDNFNKYTKIEREDGECLIDYQFRQIVKAHKWYKAHLSLIQQHTFHLFSISESAKCVKLMQLWNVKAVTIALLVKTLFPSHLSNLQDSLSHIVGDEGGQTEKDKDLLYQPHWKPHRVELELRNNSNQVFKGKYFSVRAYGKAAYGRVLIQGEGKKELIVEGLSNINRAIHEDIVIAKKLNETHCKIVSIAKKNWRAYCGSLDEQSTKKAGFILFVPIDARIPKIGIRSSQISNLMDKRIIVHVDEWKIGSKYPSGHYTETIGVIGDLETETQVLLLEHDIPYSPWSDAVLKCLPKASEVEIDTLSDKDIRRNLISEGYNNIFSVDPPGCVDIDDALHCKELSNGNLEIGVHIADVAHYIQSNSALDQEAAKRGTSVYLIDRRIDMLPSLLSTDLCSLKPNKVRLSFSVFWEVNIKDGTVEIVNTSFNRCIIHSVAALSYKEAQNIIDDKHNGSDIAKSLRNLLKVSKILKKQRIDEGALSLSSLQPKFKFKKEDKSKKAPTELGAYKMYETNSMIEEFMLFANISVAKKILHSFPSFAMLRRHPNPTKSMLSTLVKYASIKGFDIDTSSSKKLSMSLDSCVDDGDESFNQLIRIITTRCMTQAIYFISGSVQNKNDYKHYGLASAIYTHFTSPIRRYADIIVHRQLAYCCGYIEANNNDLSYIKNTKLMTEVVNEINRRHRLAQYINRASSNLYTLMFFDNISNEKEPILCNAIISGIDANCLNVFIDKYCMERRIYLSDKKEWNFDSEKLTLLKTSPPAIKYQIFDKVTVKIYVYTSRHHRKKLIVEIVDKNQKKHSINLNEQSTVDIPSSNQIM